MNKYGSLIKKYLSNQVLWMIPLCVFMFASTGVQLYAPQILRNVIDGIMGDNTVTQVIYWLTLFLLLVLFGEIIKALVSYTSGRIGWVPRIICGQIYCGIVWNRLKNLHRS